MRVLSVTHGPTVPGGVFDDLVEETGHRLERWSVPLGGSPGPVGAYDAIMLFGGAMHPDQDERFGWLEREAEFLRAALREGIPTIGVCLGGQMLARAAGAPVERAAASEVGWFEVELTPEGHNDPVFGVLPARTPAFQWHSYTFGIPGGGVELARSSVCTQGFRLGRSWALQFHAEVTLPMVEAWAAEDPDALPVPAETFLAEARERISSWTEQGREMCAAFLEEAARGAATSAARSVAAER